jgi:UDP-N-acetyl-D-mannosaminuronic acid transferase (WecB/TagA/CpsF family)
MESQDTHNINAEKAKKTTYPTLNNKEIKKLEKNQETHQMANNLFYVERPEITTI